MLWGGSLLHPRCFLNPSLPELWGYTARGGRSGLYPGEGDGPRAAWSWHPSLCPVCAGCSGACIPVLRPRSQLGD